MLKSRADLEAFVASLRIPESRRALVRIELVDHLESRIEAELVAGEEPLAAEENALNALGDPEELRASLERVEPAFALAPRRSALRGALTSAAGCSFFALIGPFVLGERGIEVSMYGEELVLGSLIAAAGAAIMWLFAPRGIGAAMIAEARATIEPRRRSTKRRRAVAAFVWSLILVPYTIAGLVFLAGWPPIIDHIFLPYGLLGLPFCSYALHVMRRARQERALIKAEHGA